MFSTIFSDWDDFKAGLFGGFYELKDMNQFYTSRKSLQQCRLRRDLQSEIKEIQQSVDLSGLQKKTSNLKLKLTYQKKVNQSKFYIF